MWLDTTHEAWHWPYSSFNNFRKWIANDIWISLDDYIWYSEEWYKCLSTIRHPIMPLLNHSDCSWILTNIQQKKIIKWGKIILENIQVKDEYFEEKLKQFIDWCELALSRKEKIYFQ